MRQIDGLQHDDTSLAAAPAARSILRAVPKPAPVPSEPAIRAKYRQDWRIVKRARFNAAMRFQKKQDASTMAFALAGLFGFLLPIYTLIFADAVTHFAKDVLDFTSYVVGALALVLGLIEQSKDYPSKSRRLHTCGLAVNKVLRRMASQESLSELDFQQLIEQYETALEVCGDNHNEVDYEIAQAQEFIRSSDTPRRRESRARLRLLKAREFLGIYGLYSAIILLPVVMGLAIWINR